METKVPDKASGGEDATGAASVAEFVRAIWALDSALQKTVKRTVNDISMTGPQRLVLGALVQCPGIAANELAGMLKLHPSTLSGILKRLIERGLIIRRAHPRDRRRAFLKLTAKGREVALSSAGALEVAVSRAIATLPKAALQSTQEVLERVVDALAPDSAPQPR